ncbi:uncharacterized protein BJ171DRAFT_150656 [Polychytrium aggregatum]|uniref:uncharacterized protein n=1 Tax=Polychytrium aggregatum TaxID=110093 RepID=UPI0022FEBD8D|nr:uncharacterized protein BJ171DRAFT_150656 [Polychytrium aggregatum]KAI9203375.1 hypothetical protein BJ171DRAFT_150656 [Polychytrium aggregatum]
MVNTRSRAAAVFSPDASPTKAINTMADRIAGLNFAGPSSPFDLASAAEPQTIHTLPLDDEDDEGTDASYIDRQSDAEDEDEPASMAADDEHPSLNRGANMELDCDEIDDLDGSTYTPQHTQEPHKTTDDDASDFFPSDGDEDGPVFTRLTKSSRDKYLHRAQKINGAMMLVFQSTNIQFQGPYLANYRKRNEDEKRWVKKGPVVIYITDGGLHTGYSSVSKIPRILAYYAYGDYSVALNMEGTTCVCPSTGRYPVARPSRAPPQSESSPKLASGSGSGSGASNPQQIDRASQPCIGIAWVS